MSDTVLTTMISLPPEEGITPDRWVILEISNDEESVKRILSGWTGGYLEGDSWRFSSAVVEEQSDNTHYTFTTKSGSTYRCRATAEGLTTLTSGMYSVLTDKFEDAGYNVKMLVYGDPT